MQKKKAVRLAGFVGALCTTGALVGFGVSGTGAYFSDSHDGTLSASTGHLKLNTSNTNLRFDNLTPGVPQTDDIGYSVDTSTAPEDIWLVFDPTTTGYQEFTGGKGSNNVPDGGLGRYGYFHVTTSDNAGGATGGFESGNLAFPDGTNTPNTGPASDTQCHTNTDGTGGSGTIALTKNQQVPWCGVPQAIKLVSNVPNGDGGTIHVSFGVDGAKQTAQNQDVLPGAVPYKIVATQTGVTPANS